MKKLTQIPYEKPLFVLYAGAFGILSFYYLWGTHLLSLSNPAVYYSLLLVKGLFFLTLPLLLRTRSLPPWLLLLNAGWFIAVQYLVHGVRPELYPLLFAVCCAGGAGFRGERRQRLLDLFTAVVGSVLALWAAAGLLVVLQGHPIRGASGLFDGIVMSVEYTPTGILSFISFFGEHRNTSAAYFILGLGLMARQWFCRRSRWGRLSVALASLLYYLALVLQHSRTAWAGAAVCAGLWAGLALKGRLPDKKAAHRMLPTLCAAFTAALLFVSFGPVSSLIARAAKPYEYSAETFACMQEFQEALDGGTLTPGSLYDSRSLLEDAVTMTGRTDIWLALLPALKEEPSQLLFGNPMEDEMRVVNRYLATPMAHMHNMLLEQLVTTGLPGFLCLALLILLLFIKMLRCFFAREGQPCAAGPLLCPLAGLLVCGLLSSLLNATTIASMGFCFLAGAFLGEE